MVYYRYVVEKVDVPQWLVKVVRNLEGKKVVSVEGGVGTSREISFFFREKKKKISDLTKGGRVMIYLPVRNYNIQSRDYSTRLPLGSEEHR